MTLTLSRPDLIRSQSYLNGKWVDASDARRLAVTDPATGATIGEVPDCTPGPDKYPNIKHIRHGSLRARMASSNS